MPTNIVQSPWKQTSRRVLRAMVVAPVFFAGIFIAWEPSSVVLASEPSVLRRDTETPARRGQPARIVLQAAANESETSSESSVPQPLRDVESLPRVDAPRIARTQPVPAANEYAIEEQELGDTECASPSWRDRWADWKSRFCWNLKGRPEAYTPVPLGESFHQARNTQVANGYAAQMVMYEYDFVDSDLPNADQLKTEGRRRLQRLLPAMSQYGQTMIVEETGDAKLDQLRCARVRETIRALGFEFDADRIVSGQGRRGIPHVESIEVRRVLQGSALLNAVSSGAASSGAGSSGASGGTGTSTGTSSR